jgi:hypothetical protein
MQSTTTDIDDRAHKRRPVKPTSPIRGEQRAYHHDINSTTASDAEPLTPSRKVNVKVIEEVTTIETKIKTIRAPRNGSEMVRPPPCAVASPGTPSSRSRFGIARKSPPTEEVTMVPAAPELARTKAISREGTIARAGQNLKEREREREKEEKKQTSPPRFGARLLSRLGATGTLSLSFKGPVADQ